MAKTPSGPWGISIRTPKKSIMRVVEQHEGESLKACLDRTKRAVTGIREKYHGRSDLIVEIISRRKAFPRPEKVVIKGNQLWCPYCVKPRVFKKNQVIEIDGVTFVSDYVRCTICGMSENDFYVKQYNDLWPKNVRVK